ncbi:MAG: hypothetical protein KatS3mg113_0285 [Planctomycetaceae bacterium]|nr:MAG: hypothetical protein KatS3mg113_0285 [Planctomycetaceae bacterium]
MSGPIVRTGATPKFWENYDRIFGNKKGSTKATPATNASAGQKKKMSEAATKKSKPASAANKKTTAAPKKAGSKKTAPKGK